MQDVSGRHWNINGVKTSLKNWCYWSIDRKPGSGCPRSACTTACISKSCYYKVINRLWFVSIRCKINVGIFFWTQCIIHTILSLQCGVIHTTTLISKISTLQSILQTSKETEKIWNDYLCRLPYTIFIVTQKVTETSIRQADGSSYDRRLLPIISMVLGLAIQNIQ